MNVLERIEEKKNKCKPYEYEDLPKLDSVFDDGVTLLKTGDFVFDWTEDSINDTVHLTKDLYKTSRLDNVYYFGYQYNDNTPTSVRTQFTQMLRGISTRELNEKDKRIFVEKPLALLSKSEPLHEIDCVVFPRSERSNLNNFQIKIVRKYVGGERIFVEAVKNDVKQIGFDYEGYFRDNPKDTQKLEDNQRKSIEEMMDKIHHSDYFHIGSQKTKYRDYFTNYLIFPESIEPLAVANKVLLVDDVATTGATLDLLLKTIKTINPTSEVLIYSIIGKL